jgi:hypothetical protein
MLRPEPHRGDVIAAGAVTLTALVALLRLRFGDAWPPVVHVLYLGAALGLVAALAVRAPREGPSPRAYQSALFVVTFALAAIALERVAVLLGAHGLRSGLTVAWVGAALAALAFALATTRNSAICTLLGAVSVVAAAAALVDAASAGGQALRWALLTLGGGLILATVGTRDRHARHAVALASAAGLTALGLAASFLVAGGDRAPGAGWELFLYACGFGLCAYSAVERAPGPGYLGVAVLVATTLLAARSGPTLLGWPLVLAVGAGALLVVGLRPSRPLPPPPEAGEAPVLDLPRER